MIKTTIRTGLKVYDLKLVTIKGESDAINSQYRRHKQIDNSRSMDIGF